METNKDVAPNWLRGILEEHDGEPLGSDDTCDSEPPQSESSLGFV